MRGIWIFFSVGCSVCDGHSVRHESCDAKLKDDGGAPSITTAKAISVGKKLVTIEEGSYGQMPSMKGSGPSEIIINRSLR